MVAAAAVPMQDYLSAGDVVLKADQTVAPAVLTGGRQPEGDRRVRQVADSITDP